MKNLQVQATNVATESQMKMKCSSRAFRARGPNLRVTGKVPTERKLYRMKYKYGVHTDKIKWLNPAAR